jgi:hypothetical protein
MFDDLVCTHAIFRLSGAVGGRHENAVGIEQKGEPA